MKAFVLVAIVFGYPVVNAGTLSNWVCTTRLATNLALRKGGVVPTNSVHRHFGARRSDQMEDQHRKEVLAEIWANAAAMAMAYGGRIDLRAGIVPDQAQELFDRTVIGMMKREHATLTAPRNWLPTRQAGEDVGAAREMLQFYREILDIRLRQLRAERPNAGQPRFALIDVQLAEIEDALAKYGRTTRPGDPRSDFLLP